MMIRRLEVAVVMLAGLGMSQAMYASSIGAVRVPVHAMFGHDKAVHFEVKNDTASPLKLKCGEEMMSVEPGQTAKVKLPVGAKVTFASASGAHAAGELLAEVAGQLNGTTISVR